jgi:hypothetical protein
MITRISFPGGEADYSPPSSAEVKNVWSCTATPQYVLMACYLVKHRVNFTFTLHFFQLRRVTDPEYSSFLRLTSYYMRNSFLLSVNFEKDTNVSFKRSVKIIVLINW